MAALALRVANNVAAAIQNECTAATASQVLLARRPLRNYSRVSLPFNRPCGRCPPPSRAMNYYGPVEQPLCREADVYSRMLPLAGASILELGCGRAEHTRAMATAHADTTFTALEVDTVQQERNVAGVRMSNVSFAIGGAEAIPAEASSFDVVMMFKSLHHVPKDNLDRALSEIHRVLVPGGLAYISEPVFAGEYNEIMRIFHDEERVRHAAFDALQRAIDGGLFALVDEHFFRSPLNFASFEDFEHRVIGVTHTQHHLSSEQYAAVRALFATHVRPDGACFEQPMRIDLLRKRDSVTN